MEWEEKGRGETPLRAEKQCCEGRGRGTGRSLPVLLPRPQTDRCQTALAKKIVCKHTPTSGKLQAPLPLLAPPSGARSWLSGSSLGLGIWKPGVGRGEGPAPVRSQPDLESPAAATVAGTPPSGRP